MMKRSRDGLHKLLIMMLLLSMVFSNFAFVSAVYASDTSSSRQVDVWDFGGVKVPSTDPLYNLSTNHITSSLLDASPSLFTTYNTNWVLANSQTIPFGDLSIITGSNDRLYYYEEGTTNVGTYNYGASLWGNASKSYDDAYNASGAYYCNGTGGHQEDI
ncbi:hypothetical protein [Paenibacillus hexagrammi]|uniref:Uncharacterized protein n=1 Tax=Paenibacillus hexagrammi TaxID=2908839 RepID=A0ABY3SHG0_9BACL|nr:hypothetical protein [Paenibacillus sp. YPD9-1]UJF32649.1 hypothetical protein L0M14_23965 [Paenibacillus sp. YPD9-1]